jgi:hypothetical protein
MMACQDSEMVMIRAVKMVAQPLKENFPIVEVGS